MSDLGEALARIELATDGYELADAETKHEKLRELRAAIASAWRQLPIYDAAYEIALDAGWCPPDAELRPGRQKG